MLKPYCVTIIKTIELDITVDAESSEAASAQIAAYGPIEACSDFPYTREDIKVKVKSAKLIRRGET